LLTVTIHYNRTLLDAMAEGFFFVMTRGSVLNGRAAQSVSNQEAGLKEVITSLMTDKNLDVSDSKKVIRFLHSHKERASN
jgi:hypothetical protein